MSKYYIAEEETVLGPEYWLYKRRWWWFDELICVDYEKPYIEWAKKHMEVKDK